MKLTKRLLAVLAALVLMLSAATTVFAADGNVSYSGNAGQFIFEPGTEYSPTDLFPDLKDVMPGDVPIPRMVFIFSMALRSKTG